MHIAYGLIYWYSIVKPIGIAWLNCISNAWLKRIGNVWLKCIVNVRLKRMSNMWLKGIMLAHVHAEKNALTMRNPKLIAFIYW